jgi:uncharacterized membrane protein YdjX (TVP38/TMEM64 family)
MVGIRRALVIQLGGLLLVGLAVCVLSRFLPVVETVAAVQQRVMHLGAWSALCYPVLYAACNVLLLPAGVLSIGGGFFFGLWWGFAIVLVGNLAGAAVAFWIARTVGRQWIARRLLRNPTFSALEPALEREGWKIILLSQLHPLFPTSLLNYLYGLTPISFGTCMLWVAIGQAPGLFLYAYLGTLGQLGLNLMRGRTHPHAYEYWIWLGGFGSAALFLVLLSRIAIRLLREAQETSDSDAEHRHGAPALNELDNILVER